MQEGSGYQLSLEYYDTLINEYGDTLSSSKYERAIYHKSQALPAFSARYYEIGDRDGRGDLAGNPRLAKHSMHLHVAEIVWWRVLAGTSSCLMDGWTVEDSSSRFKRIQRIQEGGWRRILAIFSTAASTCS